MDFKMKQTVVVVPREDFYEALRDGRYKLATITRIETDFLGRSYYVAVLGNGDEVSNVIGGPYEFDSIDYIKSVYLRFANEAKSAAAFYLDIAASLDA